MLTDDAFHLWCHRLHLSSAAQEQIATIRSSPPTRVVASRHGNVSGRYPSRKMQRTIQFESHKVELWAIFLMERDDQVLEFYDQPNRFPLRYQAASGRITTQWHTPDFFLLTSQAAGWEEWKPERELERLARTMPGRYQRDTHGRWRCPPGEAYAEHLGLSYRVRSSAEVHPMLMQNLIFLHDYWAHDVPKLDDYEALLLPVIHQSPGISVSDLQAHLPQMPLDAIWALLARQRLFTDLTSTPLVRHQQIRLFPDAASVDVPEPTATAPVVRQVTALIWDGRIWLPMEIGDQIVLQPEMGPKVVLPLPRFQWLMAHGLIQVMNAADPSPTTRETRRLLNHARPTDLERANQRFVAITAYVQGDPLPVPRRTVQRWYRAFGEAETQYGCGYVGLLGHIASQGNRQPRADTASRELLEVMIQQQYAAPQQKRAWSVYLRYKEACAVQNLPPVSHSTFYRLRGQMATPELTAARHGERAAYQTSAALWDLEATTPRHGDRPLAIAHLDHTELDIELMAESTGKVLGRPWATFLTDAYSRRLLAVYLTYDPPSYRSCMMALRICVQRHGRLPQELVVDGGHDFHSVYFDTLLARYHITKKTRPRRQPRFGSVCERLFGTANTQFVDNLLGNTQATKTPRQVSPSVNPRLLAVWTLERCYQYLTQWAYEVYDQIDHVALGQSPAEAFAMGMAQAGARMHRQIAYDAEFIMMTLPTTHKGTAKVDGGRGIIINYLQYWHPTMRSPAVAGQEVPVRYDPLDLGVAYAFIRGQWVECHPDCYAEVHGHTEKEWGKVVSEWRQQHKVHGHTRVNASGKVLARFLQSVEEEEQILLQRVRDRETRTIWDSTVVGTLMPSAPISPPTPVSTPRVPVAAVDVTALPRFEEYR